MRYIATFLAAAVASTAAAAADLPTRKAAVDLPTHKGPVYVPPPVGSFYGGLFGTLGVGQNRTQFGGKNEFGIGNVNTGATSPGLSRTPGIFGGGGQLGFDVNMNGPFSIGGVVDIQGLDQRYSRTTSYSSPIDGTLSSGSVTSSGSTPWLATSRLKLSYTPQAAWTLFATGGLAFGGISGETRTSHQITDPNNNNNVLSSSSQSGSVSAARVGWAAGGGVAFNITPALSIPIEYLHYDLGTASYTVKQGPGQSEILSPSSFTAHAHSSGDIVRIGVNYHF